MVQLCNRRRLLPDCLGKKEHHVQMAALFHFKAATWTSQLCSWAQAEELQQQHHPGWWWHCQSPHQQMMPHRPSPLQQQRLPLPPPPLLLLLLLLLSQHVDPPGVSCSSGQGPRGPGLVGWRLLWTFQRDKWTCWWIISLEQQQQQQQQPICWVVRGQNSASSSSRSIT
jgi:hypothetical protein